MQNVNSNSLTGLLNGVLNTTLGGFHDTSALLEFNAILYIKASGKCKM